MRPPNYRKTKVECCATCKHAIPTDVSYGPNCPYNWDECNPRPRSGDTKMYLLVSNIGKCDHYMKEKT